MSGFRVLKVHGRIERYLQVPSKETRQQHFGSSWGSFPEGVTEHWRSFSWKSCHSPHPTAREGQPSSASEKQLSHHGWLSSQSPLLRLTSLLQWQRPSRPKSRQVWDGLGWRCSIYVLGCAARTSWLSSKGLLKPHGHSQLGHLLLHISQGVSMCQISAHSGIREKWQQEDTSHDTPPAAQTPFLPQVGTDDM